MANTPRPLHKQVFDRLTVIELDGLSPRGESMWLCACRCGAQVAVSQSNLKSGGTRSCGCLQEEERARRSELWTRTQAKKVAA